MRNSIAWMGLLAAFAAAPAWAQGEADAWAGYLDYAYVYSSAEPEALAGRLRDYGRETRVSLDDYLARQLEADAPEAADADADEVRTRRRAIAHLLRYLASGDPDALDASVEAVRGLEGRLGRHENRYWYQYILAHRALEKGHRFDFVGDVLTLWLGVVVPLESPYDALETLSLIESPNSGFAAALPYIYENVARLILIRSQQMGLDRDIDPLAAIVKLLADGRVGGHTDVIPLAASSKDYLTRILERLNGPESDAGSLTFTLALFEASKLHDQARSLLASQGLSEETVRAMRLASGAYKTALDRADTVQGECAVYRRVLRQLGEVYAAKHRLGVDPDIEIPFTIEGAIETYAKLALTGDEAWEELGYRGTGGRESWLEAMRGLWEEIQETILNSADYYLARSKEFPHAADENARAAARLYERYLSFFERFATAEARGGIPDSAYFAAHEAAKGVGDAFLVYASMPFPDEIEIATRRYRSALTIFPFDRRLWPALTSALERQGREPEYLELVRPVADWVARSRSVETWIAKAEPGAESIAALRRALSDSLVILYLGFGEDAGTPEIEQSVRDLRSERSLLASQLAALEAERGAEPGQPRGVAVAGPAALADAPPAAPDPLEYKDLTRRIGETSAQIEKLDKQIEARSRALPLFKATFASGDLTAELRAQRSHPLHRLLRRMYHENRS